MASSESVPAPSVMAELPRRPHCFVCISGLRSELWTAERDVCLVDCRTCGAAWLEGAPAREQAYGYGDEDRDAPAAYLERRAVRHAKYLEQLAGSRGGRLLDIGCGLGRFMVEARGLGWAPSGTELDPNVAQAAARASGFPVEPGDITAAELFEAGSFEVVCLWGVVEHVPNPIELLIACNRLLAPGGLLLLETPNAQGLFRSAAAALARASRSRIDGPLRQLAAAGHVTWLGPTSLRRAAGRAGFDIIDLRGSRNDTRVLLSRWDRTPAVRRLPAQAVTASMNYFAGPLRHPNQLIACLAKPAGPPEIGRSASTT